MNEYDASTSEALERIVDSIDLAAGFQEHALYFVQCGLPVQQDAYINDLAEQCRALDIYLLKIDFSDRMVEDLRQAVLNSLNEQFSNQIPDKLALVVTGLEASILLDSHEDRPAVLQSMNLAREQYTTSLPYPFLIWLSDDMLRKVQHIAPDFWSWRSAEPERFEVTQDFLQQEVERILAVQHIEGWNGAVVQVSHLERVLEAYAEFDYRTEIVFELLPRLGDAYKFLEKYERATICYTRALEMADELGIREERAGVLNKLGIVLRERGELDQALDFFQAYLDENQNDMIGQGAALNNIGLIHLDKGNFYEAMDALETALKYNEGSGYPQALANTLGNLGLLHAKQDQFEPAIDYYHRAAEISQRLQEEDPESHWKDLMNLGIVYEEMEDRETAFRYFAESVEVSRRAGNLIGEKRCLIGLARCAGGLEGQVDASLEMYEQALNIARKIKDEDDEYRILIALADTYRDLNQQDSALTYYEEALKKAQDRGDPVGELACYIALIRLIVRDAPDSVARYKKQASVLLESTGALRSRKLNAWLVDAYDRIPGVLTVGQTYNLCLNIGRIPDTYTPLSDAVMVSEDFIYNLAMENQIETQEIEGIAKPAEVFSQTTDVSNVPTPVPRLEQDPEPGPGRQNFEGDTPPPERDRIIPEQPLTSDQAESAQRTAQMMRLMDPTAAIKVAVNLEGIGFSCDVTLGIMQTRVSDGEDLGHMIDEGIWNELISNDPSRSEAVITKIDDQEKEAYINRLLAILSGRMNDPETLMFQVVPNVVGENRLTIWCEANGIPFDMILSIAAQEDTTDTEPLTKAEPLTIDSESSKTTQALPDLPTRIAAGNALGLLGDPRAMKMDMIAIPEGHFTMGDDSGRENERPQHEVFLDAYEIARYPVTNAQYKTFIDTNQNYPEPTDWEHRSYPVGKANHPVANLSWEDAQAYVDWLSRETGETYRLPTEAEWEKAARGTDGQQYPWGNEFDPVVCNTKEGGAGGTTPIGIYLEGASPYGLLDMAGNAWEWCADWLTNGYQESETDNISSQSTGSQEHVLRGGSWDTGYEDARCSNRGSLSRGAQGGGFRVSRTVNPTTSKS